VALPLSLSAAKIMNGNIFKKIQFSEIFARRDIPFKYSHVVVGAFFRRRKTLVELHSVGWR
jgi:hypothetical protein